MPTFDTPEPISATVGLVVGDVRITAGERDTTVVEVRPSDPSNEEDVQRRRADPRRVRGRPPDGDGAELRVLDPRSSGGSIDVTIELPAGSSLQATRPARRLRRATGALGDCRIKNGHRRLRVEQAGTLNLKCGAGDIDVERAAGAAEIATGSGDVRVGELAAAP